MTKKEYIIKLIDKLSESWDFAKWLKVFMKNKELDQKTLDFLFDFLSSNLNSFTENNKNKLIKNSLNIISKLKKEEKNEISKDLEKELDNLINDL